MTYDDRNRYSQGFDQEGRWGRDYDRGDHGNTGYDRGRFGQTGANGMGDRDSGRDYGRWGGFDRDYGPGGAGYGRDFGGWDRGYGYGGEMTGRGGYGFGREERDRWSGRIEYRQPEYGNWNYGGGSYFRRGDWDRDEGYWGGRAMQTMEPRWSGTYSGGYGAGAGYRGDWNRGGLYGNRDWWGGGGAYRGAQTGAYGGEMAGPHAGRGPRGYQRSDDRIREDICERLTQHGGVDASEIEIQVSQGEVTLTGTVDDRWAKREAEDVAHGVSGVRDVHNQLRVRRNQGQQSMGAGTTGSTPAGTSTGATAAGAAGASTATAGTATGTRARTT